MEKAKDVMMIDESMMGACGGWQQLGLSSVAAVPRGAASQAVKDEVIRC